MSNNLKVGDKVVLLETISIGYMTQSGEKRIDYLTGDTITISNISPQYNEISFIVTDGDINFEIDLDVNTIELPEIYESELYKAMREDN